MGNKGKELWLKVVHSGQTKFAEQIDPALLREWEETSPHILMMYLKGNPHYNYKAKEERIQSLIDSDDYDHIILSLLEYGVGIDKLDVMSWAWKTTSLSSIPVERFSYVLRCPYSVFKFLNTRGAFKDIEDNAVVYSNKNDDGRIVYKQLKYWEFLIEVQWSRFPDELFGGNVKEIKDYLRGLKQVKDQAEFERLLSGIGRLLGFTTEKEKKKLIHRRPFVGTKTAEFYYNYAKDLWVNRSMKDLENDGPYGKIKNAVREYLKNGRINQISLDDITMNMSIVREVFEGELVFRCSSAVTAINYMLESKKIIFYEYLYELSVDTNVHCYFLYCNKAFYHPSEDSLKALKSRIIDICNENSYIKVRKLLAAIGFFLGMWGVFLIHDVAWMFASIAMAFVLTYVIPDIVY